MGNDFLHVKKNRIGSLTYTLSVVQKFNILIVDELWYLISDIDVN